MKALIQALDALPPLTADDLDILRDYLRAWAGEKVRRHGKTPLEQINPRGDLQTAVETARTLSEDEQAVLLRVVGLLHRALSPVTSRRDGRGYVQVKTFTRRKLNLETGEITERFYSYAYLRLWATAGDSDRDKARLKSIYLGKPWVSWLDSGAVTELEIIEAYHAGTLEALGDSLS